jgi:hypothetical protein
MNKFTLAVILGSLIFPAFTTHSQLLAAPLLSHGTSVQGALAYQDDSDSTQFFYVPLFSEAVFGDRLKTFRVSHFGVGNAFLVRHSDGSITSEAGAIVSGTVSIDISPAQRQALIAKIKNDFGIDNPKLLPLRLADPKIESIVLDKIVGFGDNVQQNLPSTFQVGSEVAFSVGSLDSGFAQIVANLAQGTMAGKVPPNPHFGMNIVAKAEFVGDPWRAVIDCDLQQVWSQVRKSAGVSVSYGWIPIGSVQAAGIAQDLQKTGACTFDMKEGSLANEKYGRQVLEMTKQMFEEINKSAVGGQGYFQFQPNPEAPAAGGGGGGGGLASLFGWNISVNASYSSASFTQKLRWNTTVTYTGHAMYPVALGTALAVSCTPETKQYFEDLRDSSDPCITQAKVDLFNKRTSAEAKAKAPLYADLSQRLLDNKLSPDRYAILKQAIDKMVITDATFALANTSIPVLQGVIFATAPMAAAQKSGTIFVPSSTAEAYVQKENLSDAFHLVDVQKTLKLLDKQIAKSK